MLSWDNTARNQNNSNIFHDFSLLRYKQWLSSIVNKVKQNPKYNIDEKIVFINAWNEWAEGTHLEPDRKFGYAYLQTTYDVIKNYEDLKLSEIIQKKGPFRRSEFAVILHLHYEETWTDINKYLLLSMQDHGFDLYVSVTCASAAIKVLECYPLAYIDVVENRGRDVLPFIQMLGIVCNMGYTAVCKIHSKRSVYRNDGDSIRDEIFNSIIGTYDKVSNIVNRFRKNKELGIVVPEKYLLKHSEHNMTFDNEAVSRISCHLNFDFEYDEFPAGSMFWFSPKSLEPLISIDDNFFEIESGMADGTCAHAIERLFCIIVKNKNYTVESC
jgi:lipopolysaccharide biosynthesis protein